MAVLVTTTAVLMLVYRGSARHCQLKSQKTSKCVYAVIKTEMMKTSEWSFSKYLFTRQRGCVTKDCYM